MRGCFSQLTEVPAQWDSAVGPEEGLPAACCLLPLPLPLPLLAARCSLPLLAATTAVLIWLVPARSRGFPANVRRFCCGAPEREWLLSAYTDQPLLAYATASRHTPLRQFLAYTDQALWAYPATGHSTLAEISHFQAVPNRIRLIGRSRN